jgi:hypothetical protein
MSATCRRKLILHTLRPAKRASRRSSGVGLAPGHLSARDPTCFRQNRHLSATAHKQTVLNALRAPLEANERQGLSGSTQGSALR